MGKGLLNFPLFCPNFLLKCRKEIKNPPDLAHARIYERILERCAPVLLSGKNFREEGARATNAAAKEIGRITYIVRIHFSKMSPACKIRRFMVVWRCENGRESRWED